jgi:glycerophosphoryl diester phosphodiesterase
MFKKAGAETDALVLNWAFYLFGLKLFCRGFKTYIFTTDEEKRVLKLLDDKNVEGIIMNNPRLGINIKNN